MHESENWKWSRSVVSNPQRPHGLQPPRLLCPWDFPGKSTGVGIHSIDDPFYWQNWDQNYWLFYCPVYKISHNCPDLASTLREWTVLLLVKATSSVAAAAAAKSLQSCPTLSDPMDCSPPGSSVHGIFQARVLEWGAIAFSDLFSYAISKT